jgi:phosphopantothenate-cysteine ligase
VDSRGVHRLLQGTYSPFHKPPQNNPLTFSLSLSTQLETDPSLLLPKARESLRRYGHQIVIGNDLHRRKHEVVFVSRASTSTSTGSGSDVSFEEQWLRIKIPDEDPVPGFPIKEIEEDIVDELVKRHTAWINL